MLQRFILALKSGVVFSILLFAPISQPAHSAQPVAESLAQRSDLRVHPSAANHASQKQQEDGYSFLPFMQKPEPTPTPTPVPTPLPVSNELTVQGTVVSTGAPFDSISIGLTRYHPDIAGSLEIVDVFALQLPAAGNSADYNFNNVPRVEGGYVYYISYINIDDIPGLLSAWFTLDVSNPPTGNLIVMPTFDIADVTLRAPEDGATKSLPEDFRWNARGTATDRYQLQFLEIDSNGDIVRSAATDEILHPADSVYIGSIDDALGFEADEPILWRVVVSDGIGGFGYPTEARTVTFRELQGVNAAFFKHSLKHSMSGSTNLDVVKSAITPKISVPRETRNVIQ